MSAIGQPLPRVDGRLKVTGAARSLALPFYPQMGEAEVSRVAASLAAALGRA